MTILNSKPDAHRAWRAANTMALTCLAVSVVTILGWHFSRSTLYWQWYLSAAVSLVLAVITNLNQQMRIRYSSAIYLTSITVILFAHSLTNYKLAQGNIRFDSFSGYKIVPFAVALLAPSPVWIGFLVIGVCAVMPAVLYYTVFIGELRTLLPAQDPWLSSVYAVAAFFVLFYRLKNLEIEREVNQMRAEQKAIGDIAHIFLGLRDLTNTPLQSIELTANLLGNHQLSPDEGAQFLESSLVQLRELSKILTSYEKDVDWQITGSSFDAVKMLQHKLDSIGATPNS